ncbi:MAG: SPOR domain-containing protein [Bacteroidaceae bacterium]|nr:SPOR domain-containing protein [Bacteroidaceae bacterium]
MITISRHIELLLLEHDCVIVPGFGGFIANHVEAEYCGEQEQLFLPPYRTIGFNQQLKVNDGLLVQSYMSAYDASYPAAYLQMERDIENMTEGLELTGEYELENVGLIKKGINQNITFTPKETGVLSPALYGLYSFEMKSLRDYATEREAQKSLQMTPMRLNVDGETPKDKKQKDIVIRLNRHWLDFAVSAAAAVLLFFCLSYTAMKNIDQESDTVIAAFYPVSGKYVPSKTLKEKSASNNIANTTNNKRELQTEKAIKNPETKFTIVLASYVEKRNAEEFISNLAKDGFTEARYVKNGKVSRVLYSSYPTEEDARTALRMLREQNPNFAQAWILAP